jgi:hypothetical protein
MIRLDRLNSQPSSLLTIRFAIPTSNCFHEMLNITSNAFFTVVCPTSTRFATRGSPPCQGRDYHDPHSVSCPALRPPSPTPPSSVPTGSTITYVSSNVVLSLRIAACWKSSSAALIGKLPTWSATLVVSTMQLSRQFLEALESAR